MRRRKVKRFIPVIILGVIMSVILLLAACMVIAFFNASKAIAKDPPISSLPKEYVDEYVTPKGFTKKSGAYTFIIGGTDKDKKRTDALLLAYFNPKEKTLNFLSIPRDLYINTTRKYKKVNSVYAYGKGPLLKEELSQTLGIEIDYYIVVNLSTFRKIVDQLGGVPMDISFDMDYDDDVQDLHIHLKKGQQVLDGEDAESFVRYRSGYAAADLARIEAQKIFMSSFINTALQPQNMLHIPALVNTVFSDISTDMPLGQMLKCATSALQLGLSDVQMFNLPGQWYSPKGYYTAYASETLQLLNQSFNPYTTSITTFDLTELGRTEGGDTSIEGKSAANLDTELPPKKTK